MLGRIIALVGCFFVCACSGEGRQREIDPGEIDGGIGDLDGGDTVDAGRDADPLEECEGVSIRKNGSLAYDLTPARIRVELRWQGGGLSEPGSVLLRSFSHDVAAHLEGGDKTVATLVVEPGDYRVYYQPPTGCSQGPCAPALLDELLEVRGDGNVAYDLEAIGSSQVGIDLTLAGATLPSDAQGTLELRSVQKVEGGDVVLQSRPLSARVFFDVPNGDYQLFFVPAQGLCGIQPAPCHSQLLLPRLVVDGDVSVAADIEAAQVQVSVRLNGSLYPSEPANLIVRSASGDEDGWSFAVPLDSDGQTGFVAAPGRLQVDVVPGGSCDTSRRPCQRYSQALAITKSGAPQSVLVEMKTIRVMPKLTVNGLVPTGGRGELQFLPRDGETDPIRVSAETSAVELFGGRYDVTYRGANTSYCREQQSLPCGLQTVGDDLALNASGALRVELDAAAVRIQSTLNGASVAPGSSALIALRKRSADTDEDGKVVDSLDLNFALDDTQPVFVTLDDYELWYGASALDCNRVGNELPCHPRKLSDVSIAADGVLRAELESVMVQLDARHRGAAIAPQGFDSLRVDAVAGAREGESTAVPPHGSLALFTGTYKVTYQRERDCEEDLPCGCHTLLEAEVQSNGVLTVDVPSVDVDLSVTSHGEQVSSELGQLRLRSVSNDCSASVLLAEGSGPYQIRLVPDDYVIARAPTTAICSALSKAACHDEVLAGCAALMP